MDHTEPVHRVPLSKYNKDAKKSEYSVAIPNLLPGNQGQRLKVTFRNNNFQGVCNIYQAPESSGDKAIETLFKIINKKGKQVKDETKKLELQQQAYMEAMKRFFLKHDAGVARPRNMYKCTTPPV